MRTVIGYIDVQMRHRHRDAVAALEGLLKRLEDIERQSPDVKEHVALKGEPEANVGLCQGAPLDGLLAEIKTLPLERMALGKDSPSDRARLLSIAEATIRSAEAVIDKWAFYSRSGHLDTFNCAELLLPVEIPGPVVLDATASQNMLWELLGPRATRPSVPRDARSYRNVRIHVAHASGLGKTSMAKKGRNRIERVVQYLETHHRDRSVLLCVHQAVEAAALDLRPSMVGYDVAHGNAIDGRNDWRDFDAVAILGLPFRGTVWATNTFFALQGLRNDDWFDAPSWEGYRNVRQAMEIQQVTVSVVQAINRVRCRRSVNAEGDCLPVDVFIVLPPDRRGATILDNIRQEMPGIEVLSWDFDLDGERAHVNRSDGYKALVPYMSTRLPGETTMNKIRTDLGWNAQKMKELIRSLRDPSHHLVATLGTLGVTFHHNGKTGRGSKAWLTKAG